MCLAFASFTGKVIVLKSGRRRRACAANDFAQTVKPMRRREGHAKSSASVDAIGGGYAAFQKRALTRRKACRRNMQALLGKDSSHVVSGVERVCDEGLLESVRLYMLGLPTLDDIAGSRKPVAVEESSAVHRGSSLTEDFRWTDLRAERRWTRRHTMHGRSVPRVNRQAEPDRTHILDEMNLSAPSFLPEAFRTRHRVTGPDGKVLHNVFGAGFGGRKLLGVSLLASVSCARGQSASRLSEASDLFGSGSLCYMSLLLFLLCCMLLYVLGLLYPARLRFGKQCLCRFFSWFVNQGG
jgi:hypothetical protein